MNFEEIKDKYSKELAVLSAEEARLESEIKSLKALAEVPDNITTEELVKKSNDLQVEINAKEFDIIKLIKSLDELEDKSLEG